MRLLLLACILLLLSTVQVSAENSSNDSLQVPAGPGAPSLGFAKSEALESKTLYVLRAELIDVNTNRSVRNANVIVSLDDGQRQLEFASFVVSDGILQLSPEPSEWAIMLRIDLPGTVGKDYYGVFGVLLNADKNMTVSVQPVGSVRGEVVDSQGMLVQGAAVKFSCSGEYGLDDTLYTDSFGAFSADWLPVGPCRISALSGGRTDSIDVNVSQGALRDVKITLQRKVVSQGFDAALLALPLIAVAIALIIALFFMRRNHRVPKENAAPIVPDKRMGDIVSALDENERKIVEFLMSAGGKSQQNKICRELGLPKSSLSRAIAGLEARELLKTEKLGRVNRVELSGWFLNGKKQA